VGNPIMRATHLTAWTIFFRNDAQNANRISGDGRGVRLAQRRVHQRNEP
jgi:hypothetical protein